MAAAVPPARCLFVTGTDTEVGKTWVSSRLVAAAVRSGARACGYKPLASGAEPSSDGGWRNDDIEALRLASSPQPLAQDINRYLFVPPIAPHIAAAELGVEIDSGSLSRGLEALKPAYDWIVIEGAGGWRVPLNAREDLADWVGAQAWPVVLVVGMRLGCINHALLSAESILARGQALGWIANPLPPAQPRYAANLASLIERMPIPFLGEASDDQPRFDALFAQIVARWPTPIAD